MLQHSEVADWLDSELSQVVLIRVTGADKTGVTSLLMQHLSEVDSAVLDIGQAVIHDNLVL